MSPGEVPPERLRIVGTVQRLNRQATAVGQNGNIRAAKGVIQLKKVSDNHWQLWISVANDLDGQRYDIDNVQKLRTNFIDDGKLTIEFRLPPFNVMLRDYSIQEKSKHKIVGKPSQQGVDATGRSSNVIPEASSKCVPGSSLKNSSASCSKTVHGSSSKNSHGSSSKTAHECSSKNIHGGSSKAVGGSSSKNISTSSSKLVFEKVAENTQVEEQKPVRSGIKRPLASLDMTRKEASDIRKSLKLATGSLVIADRSDYPIRGFPQDLKRLSCNNLLLRKMDYRLQDLLHLKFLSMPNNKISSIDMLMHMKSQLENVNFSGNQIEKIGEDVFRARAFSRLKILNLNGNQIRCLPNSVLQLPELMELHLCNNALQVLPYNLHQLNSLVMLKLNGNRLRALPSMISLMKLNYLDISSNPFPHINVLTAVKKRVQLEPSMTLFEKAGAVFLSHELSKRAGYSHRYDSSVLPKIIAEFLDRAKYCRQCGKMCLRYHISYQSSSQPLAQEFVSVINLKVAVTEYLRCTVAGNSSYYFY
ncbi:unnamed protein product [Allacma fusca]|uniref:PIF1/LRR1 pleckstrin homology domain-containing protein n=1 Tax=Allacma fusca TaxID=39272 RepID=A0A8J2JQ34_9HEXA|nr:unnamed protein product [Allacma fusca]